MNILTQFCAGVILTLLIIFYVIQKKIGLSTEKAYWKLLIATAVSIFFDVISLLGIYYHTQLPDFVVDFLCKTYLVTILAIGASSLVYIKADAMLASKRGYTLKENHVLVTAFLGALLIYITPIEYYCDYDSKVMYTYGMSTIVTFVVVFFFLAYTVIVIYTSREVLNPRRMVAVLAWIAVLIITEAIQFFYRDVLLVGFASAMGALALYIKLENPDINLDRESGIFNQHAFVLYIAQLSHKRKNFALVSITFDRWLNRNISFDAMNIAKIDIVKFILRTPDVVAFKNGEDEFLIAFNTASEAADWVKMAQKRFTKGWGVQNSIKLHPEFLFIPETNIIKRPEDMLYLLRYAASYGNEVIDGNITIVDKDMVVMMYDEREQVSLVMNAMENDRVIVFYQPIYSTKEKSFMSAEALVRIRDEAGNIVPPARFVEIAEKNGLIIQLGDIVFRKVCEFLSKNPPEELGVKYIEVNLSIVQCGYEYLADDFIAIMEQYKINPEWINLEITESASTDAKNTLLRNMKKLMDYGVHFSLDDFGTGQSNLNYIVDMPVNIVKFDKSMTNAYFDNGKAKYVMDAAMHMIHGMDLKIVSEGIESKEQFDTMNELGINYIQGYYFSKPLPENEYLEFVKNNAELKQKEGKR